jgi:hypothetical protein
MNKTPILLGSLITRISPNLIRYASSSAASTNAVCDQYHPISSLNLPFYFYRKRLQY